MDQELPPEWKSLLVNCDFGLARQEIANFFAIANDEAAAEGKRVVYRTELVRGWQRFAEDPRIETAIEFIEGAPDYGPSLFGYFIECCPGGRWEFYNRFLKRPGRGADGLP